MSEDNPIYRTAKVKVKTLKDRVLWLLTTYPVLRDNERTLQVAIWREDLKEAGVATNVELMDFFELYKSGKFTNPQNISSIMQNLQEEKPELRGENYNKLFLLREHDAREAEGYKVTEKEPVKRYKQKMMKL